MHCKYNLSSYYNEKACWTGGEGLGVGTEISRKTYLPVNISFQIEKKKKKNMSSLILLQQ